MVDEELKLASGDKTAEDNMASSDAPVSTTTTLVTSDGTYATQSIFSTNV